MIDEVPDGLLLDEVFSYILEFGLTLHPASERAFHGGFVLYERRYPVG